MDYKNKYFSFFERRTMQWFKNALNAVAGNSIKFEKECDISSPKMIRLCEEISCFVDLDHIDKILKSLKRVRPTATDNKGNTLLHLVSKLNCEEIIKYLIEAGFDVNAKNRKEITPLIKAILKNNEKTVKTLVSLGANLDHTYYPRHRGPLHVAVNEGRIKLINILLEAGCDVNAKEENHNTPLTSAVRNKNVEVAKILLNAGANCDHYFKGKGLLDLACQKRNLKMVELLVDAGCDVLIANRNGYTALHETMSLVQKPNDDKVVDILKVLIKAGADVNARNLDGSTPLHDAISFGEEVVDLLLKSGAQPDIMDHRGNTPLHKVAQKGDKYISLAKLLIEAGANINKVNSEGHTCLHIAARWMSSKMLYFLLNNGAQLEITDHYDQDALDYAVMKWNYCNGNNYGTLYFFGYTDYETVPYDRNRKKEIEDQIKCIELLCKHRSKMDCVMPDGYFKFYNHSKIIRALLRQGMIIDFTNRYVREVLEKSNFKSKLPLTLIRHAAICNNYKNGKGIINFDLEKLNTEQKKYYADCLEELKSLNDIWVNETMPLFNLIEGRVSSRYIFNKDLILAFETSLIAKSLPIFKEELTERFKKEHEKYKLISNATAGLQSLIKLDANAFALIYCNILKYLETDDQHTLASLENVKTSESFDKP